MYDLGETITHCYFNTIQTYLQEVSTTISKYWKNIGSN